MGHKLRLAAWVLRQLFRNVFARHSEPRPYANRQWQSVGNDLFDVPTAIAIRISNDFSSLVEIGAAAGDRIIAIKKARPSINATGMDIGADYASQRETDGVTLRRYEPTAIEAGCLIFCVGTLNCMSESEVSDLMAIAFQRNCSILCFEPRPPFDAIAKRSSVSWYHPYEAIAARNGLINSTDQRWSHTASLKNFEQWKPMFFSRAISQPASY